MGQQAPGEGEVAPSTTLTHANTYLHNKCTFRCSLQLLLEHITQQEGLQLSLNGLKVVLFKLNSSSYIPPGYNSLNYINMLETVWSTRLSLLEKVTSKQQQMNWRLNSRQNLIFDAISLKKVKRFGKGDKHHTNCFSAHAIRYNHMPLAGAQKRRHRGPGSVRFHIWAPDYQGVFSGLCRGTGSCRGLTSYTECGAQS